MSDVSSLLTQVTGQLDGGEVRDGQLEMAEAIAAAVGQDATVLVEAGTGTGKSLAYLTPTVAGADRVIIATATIALQSQLLHNDIPTLAAGLDRDIDAVLLKGRSNYLCRQRLEELTNVPRTEQLQLTGGRNRAEEVESIREWAEQTRTGDREELDPAPPSEVWSAVSVGPDECPGAARCPAGGRCFAEAARDAAAEADVIITNHHYYGLDIDNDGALLPEHDIVVFDEAHHLPETFGATCGTEISGTRLRSLARRVRAVLTDTDLPELLDASAASVDELLRPALGDRLELDAELLAALVTARDRADQVLAALRKLDRADDETPSGDQTVAARIRRGLTSATAVIGAIDLFFAADDDDVVWVDGSGFQPVLRLTPLDLGEILTDRLWGSRTAVLTSATLADDVPGQLGLGDDEILRVDSPFDYPEQALLYCAADLPEPRLDPDRSATLGRLTELVEAAGGRTLALSTSWRAMEATAEHLREHTDFEVLVQGEAAKNVLVEQFRDDPRSVLVATMSFWQGIDVPGPTLSLVTIDRLPFPRPDEPVTQARRDRAGRYAFRDVDLPRAKTLLAQGVGRLIRRRTDRGVVAVLDSRLATKKSYRWELIQALPPMARTGELDAVLDRLRELDAADPVG